MADDSNERAPLPTLREELYEVALEWQAENQSRYEAAPSEALVAELYLSNHLVSLLKPLPSHFQQ